MRTGSSFSPSTTLEKSTRRVSHTPTTSNGESRTVSLMKQPLTIKLTRRTISCWAPPDRPNACSFQLSRTAFFSILGVQPKLGRGFLTAEEQPGSGKVFLASDALWRRSFGADPHALGRTFLLDGESYTLVGDMPPEFEFPSLGARLWVPAGALGERGIRDRVSHPFQVLGRLRHDIDLNRAQFEIDGVQRQLGQAYPATDAGWRVRIRPLIEAFVGNARTSLLVLFGAVAFILLIAGANVVNLMLARTAARRAEFAIRTALGASRSRLVASKPRRKFAARCP